jgi:hypothetical protein
VQRCVLTEGINVAELPRVDVEYLFVKLRAKSVGEKIELQYRCMNKKEDGSQCNGVFKHVIDADKLTVDIPDKNKNVIQLTPNLGITLKYPTFNMLEKFSAIIAQQAEKESGLDLSNVFAMIYECTKNIFTKDEVYSDFTKEEFIEFIESLNDEQFSKIMEFFQSLPKLRYEIQFKCPVCGYEEPIVLTTLTDFFA